MTPQSVEKTTQVEKNEASGAEKNEVKEEDNQDAESLADEAGAEEKAAKDKTDEAQSDTALVDQSHQIYDHLVTCCLKIESAYKKNPNPAPDCQSDVATASDYVGQLRGLLTKAKKEKFVDADVKIIENHLKDSVYQLAELTALIKAKVERARKRKILEAQHTQEIESIQTPRDACAYAWKKADSLARLDNPTLSQIMRNAERVDELVDMLNEAARAANKADAKACYAKEGDVYYVAEAAAKLVRQADTSARFLKLDIDPSKKYSEQLQTICEHAAQVGAAIAELTTGECTSAYKQIIDEIAIPNDNKVNITCTSNACSATHYAYEVSAAVYRACAAIIQESDDNLAKEMAKVKASSECAIRFASNCKDAAKKVIDLGPLWFAK